MVQKWRPFYWRCGFCLLVDLHREGSAPAACAALFHLNSSGFLGCSTPQTALRRKVSWYLLPVFKDDSLMFMPLTICRTKRMSPNLNLFCSGTQSALWFVWEFTSRFPIKEPIAPLPGNGQSWESFPCHFILISLDMKWEVRRVRRHGQTPLANNDH